MTAPDRTRLIRLPGNQFKKNLLTASYISNDMKVLDFDAGTAEYAQFSVAMPKSWNEGTLTYQVYWGARGASSRFVYINRSGNDSGDYAPRTASSITAIEVAA